METNNKFCNKLIDVYKCKCLNETQVNILLLVFIFINLIQCIIGVIYGELGWQIASGIGIASAIISIILINFKLNTNGLPLYFIGQQMGTIIAINYYSNQVYDIIAITINSIFLVCTIIGTCLSLRQYEIKKNRNIQNLENSSPIVQSNQILIT